MKKMRNKFQRLKIKNIAKVTSMIIEKYIKSLVQVSKSKKQDNYLFFKREAY
jgi:hypothetical protein